MSALNVPLPPDDELRMPVKVLRVPPEATWRIEVTATRAATVYTHFWDGRTIRCGKPTADCYHCRQGVHRQWEAYVGCFNMSVRRDMIVVVPALCWRELEQLIGDRMDGKLRGTLLTLQRLGISRRGRLRATVDGQLQEGQGRRPGLDVVGILCRMWRCTRADLGY